MRTGVLESVDGDDIGRDVQAGVHAGVALGPQQVARALVLEGGGIQGEGVGMRVHADRRSPHGAGRIGVVGGNHIDPHPEDVAAVAGGEVDVPLAVEVVQFGSPDVAAHGAGGGPCPDHRFRSAAEPRDGGGGADDDAVVLRHGTGEVVLAVRVLHEPRVRPLRHHRVDHRSRIGGGGSGRRRQQGPASRTRDGEGCGRGGSGAQEGPAGELAVDGIIHAEKVLSTCGREERAKRDR